MELIEFDRLLLWYLMSVHSVLEKFIMMVLILSNETSQMNDSFYAMYLQLGRILEVKYFKKINP